MLCSDHFWKLSVDLICEWKLLIFHFVWNSLNPQWYLFLAHDLPEVTFPEKNLSKVCHRLVIQTLSMFSSFIYIQVKHGKKNQWMESISGWKVSMNEEYQLGKISLRKSISGWKISVGENISGGRVSWKLSVR